MEEIILAPRYRSTLRLMGITKIYGTNCQAINPLKYLNLQGMLVHTYHMENNSTYGVEDAMLIHLSLRCHRYAVKQAKGH